MKRKWTLAVAVSLLALPVLLALVEAVTYRNANRNNGSLMVAGQRREYLLYVPGKYDASQPVPLVISMHAAALWPAAQKETSQWNRLAERAGFIVVYPSGVRGSGPATWNVELNDELTGDVAFIAHLIDTLAVRYNIDRARIYADGLSNGGGMAFVLSCTMADRVAAVGVVSSAQTLPFKWCPDPQPMPMIAFHGTADPVTPYRGGATWISNRAFPHIPTWVANWSRRNRCSNRPVDSLVAASVTRSEYTSCAAGAAVVFYTMQGGGHTWPGGKPLPRWLVGPANDNVNATELLWSFFRQHARANGVD
jgi:polyhydroxybutyrate depolymerase